MTNIDGQSFPRIFHPPQQSYFLFGPRGTGKSTWMKLYYKNAVWIDLLNPEVFRNYFAAPERLYQITAGIKRTAVIIDEIQKVPTLLPVVHSIIEEKRGLQFVLSGSSPRKLKHTSADLLGGRALKRIMHPFMALELETAFSLEKALHSGLIPLTFTALNPQDSLQAYITLYLQEEIHAEGLVRNLENFARFLEAISFSHASLLNVTNIARECEVKRKTVENYIQILEDLLLAYQLPVFSRRAQRELSSHPKFYLFDTGIFRALRPKGPIDRPGEIEGAALEGLIAQHLKSWNDYNTPSKYILAFWRTRSGLEVDFIVYGSEGFWAIEVKNAKKIFPQDLKSLSAFLEDYPMAQGILLYRGNEHLRIKNILCIPVETFLLQLKPNNPLWNIE